MAEISIKADVAGRICLLATSVGATVNEGDEIVVVEAMKMEIPLPSPTSGKIKSIMVSVDDVVTEGQTLVIVERDMKT
jgi:biotin carboxyl carrier protein